MKSLRILEKSLAVLSSQLIFKDEKRSHDRSTDWTGILLFIKFSVFTNYTQTDNSGYLVYDILPLTPFKPQTGKRHSKHSYNNDMIPKSF